MFDFLKKKNAASAGPSAEDQAPVAETKIAEEPVAETAPKKIEAVDPWSLLDKETGLMYCGGDDEFYLEMLGEYVNGDMTADINAAYDAQDWKMYQTLVHALKGTSLTIGAVHMNQTAVEMDAANKDANIEYVQANHAALMEEYAILLASLRTL